MALNREPALTFGDVLVEPGHTGFSRSEIDTSVSLTTQIELGIPFLSSPMDTVTDSRLAIALRELGGFSIIHRNFTIEDQVTQVRTVKDKGLQVGAAFSPSQGCEERVARLVDQGVDMLVVDTAHGNVKGVLETIEKIKSRYQVAIMSGNIADQDGARRSIDAGADVLRTGMGPGSICTTRGVSGMGVPQLTAIMQTAEVANPEGIPVVADGGINDSDDIVKAIAGGASAVMMGRLFAQTEEACSELEERTAEQVPSRFKSIINGAKTYKFKLYRGMGSREAWEAGKATLSGEEYHGKSFDEDSVFVPEGVPGLVLYTGPVEKTVAELREGLISGMYYTGSQTIKDLASFTTLRVVTQAAQVESRPHDIFVLDD